MNHDYAITLPAQGRTSHLTTAIVLTSLMCGALVCLSFANTARALAEVPREIQIRHIGHCLKADPAYGQGVADALGIPLSEVGSGP